jgi:hypothetical protein
MSFEQLKNIAAEVIKTIENLKVIKRIEEYTELNSNITFKGEKTENEFVITVKIDENDNVTIDGNVSSIDKIKLLVNDFYEYRQKQDN